MVQCLDAIGLVFGWLVGTVLGVGCYGIWALEIVFEVKNVFGSEDVWQFLEYFTCLFREEGNDCCAIALMIYRAESSMDSRTTYDDSPSSYVVGLICGGCRRL